MKQVRCGHCGTLYEVDRTDCKNCGAPYQDKVVKDATTVDSYYPYTSQIWSTGWESLGSGQRQALGYYGGASNRHFSVTGNDNPEKYHNTDGTYSNPSHASLAPVTYPKQLPPSAENSNWLKKVLDAARESIDKVRYY
jgi:hypothetical protein